MPFYDFDAIPDKEVPLWKVLAPAGWYPMRVQSSKEEDGPYGKVFKTSLISMDQDHPTFEMTEWLEFSPKKAWLVKLFLKAVSLLRPGEAIYTPGELVNCELAVKCEPRERKDKSVSMGSAYGVPHGPYRDISLLEGLRDGSVAESDWEPGTGRDPRWSGVAKGPGKPVPPPAKLTTATKTHTIPDDEIPF